MLHLLLILIISIILGIQLDQNLFNEKFINNSSFDVKKLNIINPPIIEKKYNNKLNNNKKHNNICNNKQNNNYHKCFLKSNLKYDGIWGKNNFEFYYGKSPSFEFIDEIIDNKYFTDDGCVGGNYLDLCCDNMKIIKKTKYN